MFANRSLVIATKHQKEQVIAPLMESALGLSCFVPTAFDSDQFGTFSGEIERDLDPLSTARQKCLAAMRASNCDLGLASEGSFGAHPNLFFVPADDELLIFIDQKNQLEIIVREVSTKTNFKGKLVKSYEELLDFATSALFPSHALILRKSKENNEGVIKGITSYEDLELGFNSIHQSQGEVYVETDMRAMFNPSRMNVIASATEKLIEKIKSTCPKCDTHGFEVHEAKPGLPCSLCGSPTRSTLSFIYKCQACAFTNEVRYPNDVESEDPTYCDFCNP